MGGPAEEVSEEALRQRAQRRGGSFLIDVVALVHAVEGVLGLACGGAIAFGGTAFASWTARQKEADGPAAALVVGGGAAAVAGLIAAFAAVELAAAYGVRRRRYWGWTLSVFLGGVGVLFGFGSLAIGDACCFAYNAVLGIFVFAVQLAPRHYREYR